MLYNRVGFGYGLRPMTMDEINAESEGDAGVEQQSRR